MKISIETEVNAPLRAVWDAWVTPEDIMRWNFAADDWRCPRADLDLEVGGGFNYRMEAKDGSAGFDLEGEFTEITPYESLHYRLADDREVVVQFVEVRNGVKVIETFEAEGEHSAEQQRQGWLSILNNFKKHVESKSH